MKLLGNKHWAWRGGKSKHSKGYIRIYCPGHPRACNNMVFEHILVAEKTLGRFIKKHEKVHHINGVRDDNRPNNLTVFENEQKHRESHRFFKRYSKNNLPLPKNIGEKITKIYSKNSMRVHECCKCLQCGKLFWKDVFRKGYCSYSCGLINRNRGCQE